MLKRLKKIIKTGVFRNAKNLAQFEFGKLTVFYGQNTFGKTTLKDVFYSITKNDTQILFKRQSIPDDISLKQHIDMSFEEGGSEQTLKFENGTWNHNTLQNRLLIFDNEFTHKNLITGYAVTRDNKESFSDFILGEEGVKLSEEIGRLKKDLQDAKGNVKKPDYLKNVSYEKNIHDFLELKVSESEETLEKLKMQKVKELQNLADTEKIKNLKEVQIPELRIEAEIETVLALINAEFKRDYKEVTAIVLQEIQNHLIAHVNDEGGQSWIAQGVMKYKKGDNCPFCGQSLSSVIALVNAYNNYFNDNYKNFAKKIADNLNIYETDLSKKTFSIFSAFQTAQLVLGDYKKYNPQIEYQVNLENLKLLDDAAQTALEEDKRSISIKISSKKREPHMVFPDIRISDNLKHAFQSLQKEMQTVAVALITAIKGAEKLKKEHSLLTAVDIIGKKAVLEQEIELIIKKTARLKEDASCQKYIRDIEKIKEFENDIKKKSTELEQQQSEYVKKYFNEFNAIYRELGSHGFELKSVTNNRGYKKIYELKIIYKGKEVSSDDVSKVLSESDKRSLAFAVFLSKLKHIENKKNYIIVLDDPVVSFDEKRIRASVDIIKNITREFKQVIVLTHYPSLIKKLVQTNCEGVYLEIVQDNETSYIQTLEREHFILSEYELAFRKIHGFIQREHQEDISKDCRIFMEKYLQFRFQKGIKEEKIVLSPLKDFISALKDKGHLDDVQYQNLENFRECLNPDHHSFIFSKNDEDMRNYANNLINNLYDL